MPVLTPEQLLKLGIPPRPTMPSVSLVDPATGKPSQAWSDYLAKLDDWLRKLVRILGE